jgi:phage/plasmid-like protein (TIGR03299 family)
MKKSYKPIQNHEAFAFFDSVVGTGEAVYETAGSVFQGKRVFLVAKLPSAIFATPDDRVDQYLTLMNTHDGSSALRMYFTPIRVVCNNTLMASLRGMKDCVSIQHSGDIGFKIKEAQDALGIANNFFKSFDEIVSILVQKQADSRMVDEFLKDLFKPAKEIDKDKAAEMTKQAQKKISRVKFNFECDPKNTLSGINGTMWSLWNAIAQFGDHESRSVAGSADNRMNSIMNGFSADLKQEAFDKLLALV